MSPRWFHCLIAVLLGSGTLRAQLEISEFMARNVVSLADTDRAYPDWIELRNTSGADLSLDGWYLTDTPTNLTRWRLPAQIIGTNSPVVIFASGKNRAPTAGAMHTDFKLPGLSAPVPGCVVRIESQCGGSIGPLLRATDTTG
jgi:Lamin Tail Domain